MKKSISVVIPNYNGSNLLRENLPYVFLALKTSGLDDYEIIVADDASTDDSISFLQVNYPEIIVVQNKTNQGFSGNTNSGIYKATKDLILILNSDVQLQENYFIPLLKYFDDDKTFGVMGRIISMSGDKIQDGAKFPSYSFANIISTKNYLVEKRNSLYSFFLSGANALIDREKLLQLGGFNELFNPYYGEDVDLGISAWRVGYKLYYEHNALCRHPNSATIKKESSKKVKLISKRNKLILHYLHLENFELFIFFLITIFKSILKLFLLDFTYLKAFFTFFKMRREIKERKINYSKIWKLNLHQVKSFIIDNIKNDVVIKF